MELSLHGEKIRKIEKRESKIFEVFVKYGLSDAPCCIPVTYRNMHTKVKKKILNDQFLLFEANLNMRM